MAKGYSEEDDEADDSAQETSCDGGGIDSSRDEHTAGMQREEVEGDRSPNKTEDLKYLPDD